MRSLARLRAGLSLALVFLLAGTARADIVWLENGGKLEGEIVREGDGEVEIKGLAGTVVIQRSDIKKIEKKQPPDKEFETRRAALALEDVPGRVELAQFVIEKRLPVAKAGELALEAFELAPHDGTVIELLRKKLDYKFEKTAWLAPERWYPEHGYVRHAGGWITLEQAAFLDAETVSKQARSEQAAAEKALSQAERDVTAAGLEETRARKEVDRIKGILDKIDASVAAAQTDVANAQSDLQRAQDQTVAAQRDLAYLQSLPTPTDNSKANDLGRRINTAQSLTDVATANEQRARRRRDAAQGALNDLLDLKAEGPKRVAAAQGALDAAIAKGKAARDDVPVRREATGVAKKRVEECRAAELTAKSVATDRRAQEAKAETERDEALKTFKKDAAATAPETPGK